jgi:hypothetical protein
VIELANTGDVQSAVASLRKRTDGYIQGAGFYAVKAYKPRKSGTLVEAWERTIDNLIPTAALNDILTKYLKNGTTSAAWYVGLVDNTSVSYSAANTLASHTWTEFTSYSGNRKAITFGTAAAGVLASSSIPTFTASGSGTLDGLFVCDAATGTSGVLLSEGAFTGGDAPVANGYVLTATYQLTLASA